MKTLSHSKDWKFCPKSVHSTFRVSQQIDPLTPFIRQLLIILFALCCVANLHAKDYTLINQLPKRLLDAKQEGHKGWDSGVTPTMREATYRYNDALLVMVRDLVKAYYPKGFISSEEIDAYLESLYTVHRFKQSVENPTGEFQGRASTLDVPANVSGDLENIIGDMVQAISAEYPDFDYKEWTKKWQKAKKKP